MGKSWSEMTPLEREKYTAMLSNAAGLLRPRARLQPGSQPPTAAQLLARRRAYDRGDASISEVGDLASLMDPEHVHQAVTQYGGTRAWMGW